MTQEIKYTLLDYPEENHRNSGYKVSWLYYDNEDLAKLAAHIAEYNAHLKALKGFDFGYQCPGYIMREEVDGNELFKVTIP